MEVIARHAKVYIQHQNIILFLYFTSSPPPGFLEANANFTHETKR